MTNTAMSIWLVTITYPNATHNRTETFYIEDEAHAFFHSFYDGLWPVDCQHIFLIFCDGTTAQLLEHASAPGVAISEKPKRVTNFIEWIDTRVRCDDMSTHPADVTNGDPSMVGQPAFFYDESWFIQIMQDGTFFTICGNQDFMSDKLYEAEAWLWFLCDNTIGYTFDNGDELPALRQWYVDTIGYDPMTDDPTMTHQQLVRLIASYKEEENEQAVTA